jgi:hypothetical protein
MNLNIDPCLCEICFGRTGDELLSLSKFQVGNELEYPETFPVEALRLWEDDTNGVWFLVKWLGSKELSVQWRGNFPNSKAWCGLLGHVYEKGLGAQMTNAAGRANTRGRSQLGCCAEKQYTPSAGKESCYEISHLDVRFGATEENCVPFSLLNLLGASKSKAKTLRKTLKTTLCGLSDLAAASHVLGVGLKCWHGKSLAWLVERKEGSFLLLQGVHCVGVECDRGWLYDSTRPKVLHLAAGSLRVCGFTDTEPVEIRQVLL